MKKSSTSLNIKNLTLLGLMTALVVLVQIISANIKFGPFSITLAHIPIVIGAAMLGPVAGAWLGLTMGIVVLASGGATLFIEYSPVAAVALTLLKSTIAGLVSGLVYKFFEKKHPLPAISLAAILCPITNTGIFLIGTFAFFLPLIETWATAAGSATMTYIFVGLIGWNFVVEMATSLVLTPLIQKIIAIGKKMRHDKSYI